MLKIKIISPIIFLTSLVLITSCSNSTQTSDNYEVVELPDGSLAYLNHHSSIDFEDGFAPRKVEITGEVFLIVTEGETPFSVQTELGEIEVLGTEFNVKSSEDNLEVEVEEGTVELKTKSHQNKIGRGEKGAYQKGGNGVKKGKADFKFKIWIKQLEIEFEKLGKEIKHGSKVLEKESKKAGKDLKKGLKKLDIKKPGN